ncbi:MAG: tRNA (adenosine(37)-N6)-threonylcarbamoyltransferase complex dimerization subunit type 1 TsaB [Clostridiales bacterium]|jgi:tRNA threonylcarbamoyladenosine biosynthesis protein TsaB|nr:tRNA (adenosine(37)-N6)-threonylcarbamoyltransferase complex dimerization subunit type 1 TsaB [Clostridiales bacterium]
MNVLIADTTRETLLLIFLKGNETFVRKSADANGRHTARLFSEIDALLKEAGADAQEIDFFAGAVGPGSYTGIRIGVCALTAMAKALKKPLVSVNSLEVFAYKNRGIEARIFLVDSGHDYYALERTDGGGKKYFILNYDELKKYKNAVKRDENDCYADEIIGLVKEKIANGEYGDTMVPFYMKKSQAGREYRGAADPGIVL